MQLTKDIEIVDLALFLPKHKTLIISDIHIGYEEALNKQGVLIPRFSFEDQVKRLKAILAKTKPETVVLNGDLKHEFGRISEQEWRDTLNFLNLLSKDYKVILIKGNHDAVLGPIAGKKNLEILDYLIIDKILITHGDKVIKVAEDTISAKKGVGTKAEKTKSQISTIIIGHHHPAATISDGTRREKYKCFLVGKYEEKKTEKRKKSEKPKTLIAMPSFNLLTEGTAYHDSTNSPYIKDKAEFEVYVVGDEVYRFGKYGELVSDKNE